MFYSLRVLTAKFSLQTFKGTQLHLKCSCLNFKTHDLSLVLSIPSHYKPRNLERWISFQSLQVFDIITFLVIVIFTQQVCFGSMFEFRGSHCNKPSRFLRLLKTTHTTQLYLLQLCVTITKQLTERDDPLKSKPNTDTAVLFSRERFIHLAVVLSSDVLRDCYISRGVYKEQSLKRRLFYIRT